MGREDDTQSFRRGDGRRFLEEGAVSSSKRQASGRVLAWLARHPIIVATFLYVAFTALVFREGGFGSSETLPEGSNALNTWLVFGFYHQHPTAAWVFPFTDWGQPYGGFTGPTVLSPAIALLTPTLLVRAVEFTAIVAAAVGMMIVVRRAGGTALGGFLGGFYYATFAETTQFFEGHVPAMISVAIAPPFLYLLWRFLRAPRLSRGLLPAVLLYLMVSIGDLGMLYFYLFFAVLLAGYAIVQRQLIRRYSLHEFGSIVAAVALVTALSISWLYPFLAGIRPQYTTNITVNILPFDLTSGENLVYVFAGYVQDNSFVQFTYGQFGYGPWGSLLLPFSLLLPVAISIYAFVGRRRDRIAFFASALLAMVFATGHLYPGLAQFNALVFEHVPFFNTIPALFRWTEYSLLVFGVLLGKLVSDIERDGSAGFPRLRFYWSRVGAHLPIQDRSGTLGHPRVVVRWPGFASVPSPVALAALSLAVVVLVLGQNVTVVTAPPSTFQFPAEYTASYQFLQDHPLSGEVLAIPFGGIYDRAPWGGVSGSAALLTPYYTGADTAIYEAGTPYSLAIDQFVSGGLTYGGSRNMSEFLASANVQYIVATRYTDWSYSSSSASPSVLSYTALANQTGLGPATTLSSTQTVYSPADWTGNLSFHPSYLVYFGADSILYSILDSPWYLDPSMAFVNGSTVGDSLDTYVAHAAGIIVAPGSLLTLGPGTIQLARANHVPIIEVVSPSDYTGNGTQLRPDAWNATGGIDLQFNRANVTAQIELGSNLLSAAGYTNLTLSGQLAAPPESTVVTSFGNASVSRTWSGSAVLSTRPVNYSAPGYIVAGEENHTINSSQYVNLTDSNGTVFANWTPLGNATDFQYLRFDLHDLSGWNGFAVEVRSPMRVPLEGRIGFQSSSFALPGYATIVPTFPSTLQYRFLFPSGGFGMPADLLTNVHNLSSIEIGIPAPGLNGSVVISNLTLLKVSTPRLSSAAIGVIPAAATTFNISLPPTGRLGFLEISTGASPVVRTYERDLLPQAGPTDMSMRPASAGWGVMTLAQSYSPFWHLAGPGPAAPTVVDIGLTGWLVNSTPGAEWRVTYLGDGLLSTSLVLETIAVPLVAAPYVVAGIRSRSGPGRRRGPSP